jgi:lipoteichoic acid synthase
LFFVPMVQAQQNAPAMFTRNWWSLSLYSYIGLIPFHGYDAYRFVDEQVINQPRISDQEYTDLQQWLSERADNRTQLENDALFGAYRGANVIMVQIEALQNFMIGQTYHGQEFTPNFNRLMKDSMYFNRFYHQTADGRTSDADFLANCSLYPLSVGSVSIRYGQNDYRCLPRILKENGYSTSAYHAFEGGFWNRNVMYENMGYDQFYDKKDFVMTRRLGWSLEDRSFFQQSVNFISQNPQPSYSFLITLTSHHPFKLPAYEQKLNLKTWNNTILGDYLQSVHYVDKALGQFVQELKDKGLWDNSIVIFYGDHDNNIKNTELYQSFFESMDSNELKVDSSNANTPEKNAIIPETSATLSNDVSTSQPSIELIQMLEQVPLLIHLPDRAHTGVDHRPAGQIDLAPTILHLLGISTNQAPFIGSPLLKEQAKSDRLIVFSNGSFDDGKHFYKSSGGPEMEHGTCYDLITKAILPESACNASAEQATQELRYSEQFIENNLLSRWDNQESTVRQKAE